MRKKRAKQLRQTAALMTQGRPFDTRKVYKRLKTIHKNIRGEK